MATLTRAEMEAVITGGGSVMIAGRVVNRIGDLPTDAELAKGDPAKEQAAATTLQQQIAAMQAQLDSITQAQEASATPPTSETPPSDGPKARSTPKKD